MKKAYLVDFNVCTRVVIDSDDPKLANTEKSLYVLIAEKAITNVMPDIQSRLSEDHPLISEDFDMPYDPDGDPDDDET